MKSESDWCTGILKNKIKNLGIYIYIYIYIYIDFFLFHSGLLRIGGFQGARKFGRGGSINNREYLLGERKRGKKRLANASPWIKKYM